MVLLAYLPTCLLAYLPTCLLAYLPTCLLVIITLYGLQDNKKMVFFVKFSGKGFDDNLIARLDLRKYESFVDPSDSYVNAVLFTNKQTRPSALKTNIERYNETKLSDENKIILRAQSEFDDEIMTMSQKDGETLKRSGFYKRILEAKARGDPTYRCWTSASEQAKSAPAKSGKAPAAPEPPSESSEDEEDEADRQVRVVKRINQWEDQDGEPVPDLREIPWADVEKLPPRKKTAVMMRYDIEMMMEDHESDIREGMRTQLTTELSQKFKRETQVEREKREALQKELEQREAKLKELEQRDAKLKELERRDGRQQEHEGGQASKEELYKALIAEKEAKHTAVLQAEQARHAEVMDAKNETIRVLLNAVKPAAPA